MTRRILAYAFMPGEPPAEIQLWDVGPNPTDYGVHLWTERSAQLVMDRYVARGNPLQIDVEHNNADPDVAADAPPAGGYARLEIRAGAPWLVFEWSAFAVEQIRTRQRLFLSPDYLTDKATGEIIALLRVSLVADAATHNARILASTEGRVRAGGMNMNLALFLAALKAALSAEDPEVCKQQIANLITEVTKAAGGDAGGATGEEPAPEDAGAVDASATGAGGDEGALGDKPPGDGSADDPTKKKEGAVAARTKAGATQDIATVTTILSLKNDVVNLKKENDARARREKELALENRVLAAGKRIPEDITIDTLMNASAKELDGLIKLFPDAEGDATQHKGVRASSRVTQGDRSTNGRPPGELDPETQRHLARVFNIDERPESPVVELPDGRVRMTHIVRPKSRSANGG